MFFVDAICRQYFIPTLQQHFLSQIQSFMFSITSCKATKFNVDKHSTMVEICIERHDAACLKRFSISPRLRITWKFQNKLLANPQYDIFEMAAWWRAGQKFLSSLWINQHHHCRIKGLQDRHENAHQNRDSCISQFFKKNKQSYAIQSLIKTQYKRARRAVKL